MIDTIQNEKCDSLFKHQITTWGRMQFDPTTIHCNAIHYLNIKLSHGGECNSTLQQCITMRFII
jgi:hypothetical protein